ncbi:MAG TPA: ABC transporter permease [bacterium]|nr:ABC transporter permease [bacterium]
MKLLTVAKWEFVHRVKSKWFIFSLVFPLIIIGISVLPTLLMQEESGRKTFALIDETNWVGEHLMQSFTEQYRMDNGEPRYEWIPLQGQQMDSPAAAADSMLAGDIIDGYIVIPADIRDTRRAEYYGESVGNFRDQMRFSSTLSTLIARREMTARNLNPELIEDLTRDVELATFEVRKGEAKQGNELLAFAGPYFYVFILLMAIFMSAQILMRSVLEERQNRLVELLISSVTTNILMSGKILGIGAMGLLQVIIYIALAQVVAVRFGVELVTLTGLIGFFLYFILGFLLYGSFYAAVGSLFTSEQDAQQAIGVISLIIVVPVIFLPMAIMNPEATLVQILSYVPPITPFFMIMRMNLGTLPFWEYVLSFSILVGFTYLTMRLAGKVFNTAVLMYGKRPTVPEIVRWLRA